MASPGGICLVTTLSEAEHCAASPGLSVHTRVNALPYTRSHPRVRVVPGTEEPEGLLHPPRTTHLASTRGQQRVSNS
jgi:hypothetical protein